MASVRASIEVVFLPVDEDDWMGNVRMQYIVRSLAKLAELASSSFQALKTFLRLKMVLPKGRKSNERVTTKTTNETCQNVV